MAITRTLAQLRADVRKFSNAQGTTALLRHPDADVNDYINRALGSLHRRLRAIDADHRILSQQTVGLGFALPATEAGTSIYALPSDFDFLISVGIVIDSRTVWLEPYETNERHMLVSEDQAYIGRPFTYRLLANNIEFLPVPQGEYSYYLFYTSTATQLSGDSQEFDTIARLDDYVIAYASRFIATKDRNWDLVNECKALIGELEAEIDVLARGRDKNSNARITDIYQADRWGRRGRCR